MICIFIGAYFSDLHFNVFICFILARIDEGRINAFQGIHNFLLFKKNTENFSRPYFNLLTPHQSLLPSGRGGENRTPIKSFGDSYATIIPRL